MMDTTSLRPALASLPVTVASSFATPARRHDEETPRNVPMTPANVLLIAVDQWPAALFGYAGNREILTPTIDQLARLGTRYRRAYSECPICIPARRTLMTGLSPRTHGDRVFKPAETMPKVPLLAGAFRDAGYQTVAVGKLHVFPQRDHIGFDEIHLAEEGRQELGGTDDYEMYLADQGHAGEQFLTGMCNNDYQFRPWHLEERHHVTNWTTRTAARAIKRRDPTRPGFWHVSYTHPHPPLAPLQAYLDLYRDRPVAPPTTASWSEDVDALPAALKVVREYWPDRPDAAALAAIRRAYYALCTHIDHQLRVLFGTLREERLLEDTIIVFASDHGDMLGEHGLWAKRLHYEYSANVPLIVIDRAGGGRIAQGAVDDRPVGLMDVMPTLLDLCGLPIPKTVEGMSLVGDRSRDFLYGECREGLNASRMIHDGRHKLIWYPAGDRRQLFDLDRDPKECRNLTGDPAYAEVYERLERALVARLYGPDLAWVRDGRLCGFDPGPLSLPPSRTFGNQRGFHYPPPPADDPANTGKGPGGA
jgi:choline-sulfatase